MLLSDDFLLRCKRGCRVDWAGGVERKNEGVVVEGLKVGIEVGVENWHE